MKSIGILFLLTLGIRSLSAQVTPLTTTTWNQTCNYNDSCPENSSGPCGNTLTGCNATAWAQIMKYHNHPSTGCGSNSYTPLDYPTQTVDFGMASYNFSSMPLTASSSNSELAELLRHAGVAVNTNYSPSNSVASFNVTALKKHFKYSLAAQNRLKANYSNTEWENIIIAELQAGRPVAASGGSHVYIIDGYQIAPSLKFHINFGWGGAYNDYYNIHNVLVAGSNYTPNQIGTGIQPRTELEVSPDTIVAGSNSQTVLYTLASDTAWGVVSDQSWSIPTFNSAIEGYYDYSNGAGSVLAANSSYTPRYSTLTFTDGSTTKTIVIQQNGISPSLYVSPANLTYSASGGIQTVAISTDSNWIVTPLATWITPSVASGIGSTSIDLTTLPNPSSDSRIGTVLITRGSLQQIVTITQGGSASYWCVPVMNTPFSNGITNVTLNTINRTSPNDEGYIVTNDTTVLELDSSYTLSVTFVSGNAPGAWIDWNQDGDFNDASEAIVSPSGTWYPSFAGIKNQTFTVPVGAQEGLTRMRVYAKSFGTGPVSSPCGLTDNGGDIEDFHIRVQDHRHITISPTSLTTTASGDLQAVTIDSDSTWNSTSSESWVSLSIATALGSASTDVSIAPNPSTEVRTATVLFVRGTYSTALVITQTGIDTTLTFIEDTLFIPSNGAITSYTTNSNSTYTISSNQSWADATDTIATGNHTGELVISDNPSTSIRSAWIYISAGTFIDSFLVIQDSSSYSLETDQDTLFYEWDGTPQLLQIITAASWSLLPSESWISSDLVIGTGNNLVTISAANNMGSPRTALLDISNGLVSKTIVILQAANTSGIAMPASSSFSVYPNPFENKLFIQSTGSNILQEITLFSANGTLIQQAEFDNQSLIELEISKDLAPGIYLLRINGTETIRIAR